MWIAPPGTELGGAGRSLIECAAALRDRGHHSHVVVATQTAVDGRLASVAHIHICPHNRWIGSKGSVSDRARWLSHDLLRATPTLVRLIREHRIDVVVTNTITAWVGGLAARRAAVPHAWYIRELPVPERNLHFLFGVAPTFLAMRNLTRYSIVVSRFLADSLGEPLRGVHLQVVWPAAGLTEPPSPRASVDGSFRLLLLGSIIAGKGQTEAVLGVRRAVEMGVDVELTIAGDPETTADLERINDLISQTELQERVRILPFTTDIGQLFADADALLVCARDEGFGRVTIEAMKAGIPVIGARSGATPDLIRDGDTGLLYSPGDVPDLAAQIARLAADRAISATMGGRAATWASATFTRARLGRELEAALQAMISA